jgi:hypothetical protein
METIASFENTAASREVLEEYLRDQEGRSGLSIDIRAVTVGESAKTVTRHNIFTNPPDSLFLVIAGSQPPAGKKLDYAGTAFIEGKQTVVAIYR